MCLIITVMVSTKHLALSWQFPYLYNIHHDKDHQTYLHTWKGIWRIQLQKPMPPSHIGKAWVHSAAYYFGCSFHLIYEASCKLFSTKYGINCVPIVPPFSMWAVTLWERVSTGGVHCHFLYSGVATWNVSISSAVTSPESQLSHYRFYLS